MSDRRGCGRTGRRRHHDRQRPARRTAHDQSGAGCAGRARVIGSLTGDGIRILLDAVQSGVAVLDLSEVDQVDESGVRALAALRPDGCTLVSCPRWLELWMTRELN
jgi:hypothetical protein